MNPLVILAAWRLLTFTTPEPGSSPIAAYEAQRCNATAGYQAAKLWHAPGDSVVIPRQAGAPESVYVSVTDDPANPYSCSKGGAAYRLRAVSVNGAAAEHWSNVVIIAEGALDTLWTDGREWRYPAAGRLKFVRSQADSTLEVYGLPGPIARGREALRALMPATCSIFGWWVEAGARRACPAGAQ